MTGPVSARNLRRRAALFGAACACFAGVPAVTVTHGHPLVAAGAIAIQIVLLALATTNFVRARRLSQTA